MSQTNTDYLFQAIPAGSDRAPNPGRASYDAPSFGDQLSHASPSVFDVVRPMERTEPTVESRTDDHRWPSEVDYDNDSNDQASGSATPSDESNNATSRPADSGAHACEPSNTKNCADDEHRDSDDASNDESTAAEGSAAAATSQLANVQPPTPLDAKVATDKAAAGAVADDANLGKMATAQQVPVNKAPVDTNATESANQDLTATDAPADDGAANIAQVDGALGTVPEPDDRTPAKPTASKNNDSVAGKADDSKSPPSVPGPAAIASDAAAQSLERVLSTSNAGESSKEALAADAAKPTDADSRRRTKLSVRAASSRSVTEPTATKPDSPSAAGPTSNIATPAVSLIATNEKTTSPPKPGTAKTEATIGPLTSAMRSATEMKRGGRNTETAETPQVDPSRFIGRVAKAFHTAQERGGTLQLRLSPPELGALKLQLTVKDGVLTAALETESADTRRLLLDHLPALRDRLAEQNIRVDRFDVDVRQDQNRDQSNPRGMNQHAHQRQPEQSEPRNPKAPGAKANTAPPPASPTATSRIGNSSINLVV